MPSGSDLFPLPLPPAPPRPFPNPNSNSNPNPSPSYSLSLTAAPRTAIPEFVEAPPGGRLRLRHVASRSEPREVDAYFTRTVDVHAAAMRRLAEDHQRRFRAALFALQRSHPDLWWRMERAVYYNDRMPEVLANNGGDDVVLFSRVAREVRDCGVEWVSMRK